MSHELRTPLNHIIGFSDMMQSGIYGPLGNERYADYARDIGESGRYLLDVISDILDMSSSRRAASAWSGAGLAHRGLEEEADGLRQTAAARNIALEIDTAGPLHVIGDRRRSPDDRRAPLQTR